MNKFSITFVSLAAMAGFALAQPKTGTTSGSAGGSAATGAGATMKAGAGAGSAGAKAGAGAGSAAAKAGAGSAAAAATPKVEAPKPPTEIKDALKQMGTRMNCTGTAMMGADMKTEGKLKATGTMKAALDGWWIQQSMTITMGEGKAKQTLKIEGYMTYDTKLAKWRSVGVSNDGAQMVGTSDMKGTTMDAMSDMTGGMMGDGKFREHGDMSDPKAGMKMTGEMSKDGGKTWTKVYDMTCKK